MEFGSGQYLVPYVSASRNLSPGASWDWQKDFVPVDGPRGLRNVIHRVDIELTGNFDSVTTSSILGEDMAGLLQHLNFGPGGHPVFDLDGDELRAWMFDQLGNATPPDPSDLGASASAQTSTYRFQLPIALPRAARPKDYALPVDYFRRSDFQFRTTVAGNTSIQTGGTYVLNATTGVTVRIVVWCAEEYTWESKQRFTARAQATEADDRFTIEGIAGRPILSLFTHKSGVNGGADMGNITLIDAPRLGLFQVRDEDMEYGYRADAPGGDFNLTTNPFDHVQTSDAAGANCFPIVWCPAGAKLTQLPIAGTVPEIVVNESSAITSKRVVKTYVVPQDASAMSESAIRRGVDLTKLKAKTLDGKPVGSTDPYWPFINKKVSGRAGSYRG